MRSWGWSPRDGISVLARGGRDQSSRSPQCEDPARRVLSATRKWALARKLISLYLDLGTPSLQNYEK